MEPSPNPPKTLIAAAIENLAQWRREQAEEYPDDERNIQSAEGLEALALFVRTCRTARGPTPFGGWD